MNQQEGEFLFGEGWYKILKNEVERPYFNQLGAFLKEERKKNRKIYPDKEDIFKAFKKTSFEDVKIVILGQDPYSTINSADGLAFSTKGFNCPPSLQAIFNEIEVDVYDGLLLEQDPNLERWAEQGVFLLNRYLTVDKNTPLSHSFIGWKEFTNFVIKELSDKRENLVFILWGKKAQEVEPLIDSNKHLILKTGHPATVSYGTDCFSGNKHFSKSNTYLEEHGRKKIIW